MKYVLGWTQRLEALPKENEESAKRALELFYKWQPPEGVTFHQFVGRLDGEGAFAVVETDNPNDVLDASAKFARSRFSPSIPL